MILNEKYLAQFERNSGLKKGTVGTKNHLHESYMEDARQNDSNYQFFIVMDSNGMSKIIGGNDYKQDAIDAANEYLESGIRLKVYSGKFLKGKGIDPEDDANWGNQNDINSAMQSAGGGQQQVQQEAIAGVPSQQDVDAFQASEYEGNDEPENDKDAESQDALHLGEGEDDGTPGWPRAMGLITTPEEDTAFAERQAQRQPQSQSPVEPQVCIGLDPNWMKIGQQEQDMVAELDNMMGGNDAPSVPAMGGGDEWMDAPNDGQMNSLGDGGDELELGEGMTAPDLNGSRAASARAQDNAAFYRNQGQSKGNMPANVKQSRDAAKDALAQSSDNRAGKYSYKPTQLPEAALALNEDSKALYAKAKVDESQYERFLRNAGVKK